MLEAISVKNYRTFSEEMKFEIAPITVLLGANSSGKSSITRLFPLLNQSMSARLSAPILWVSDILDYGSFTANVHRFDPENPIVFGFQGRIHQRHIRRSYTGGTLFEIAPTEFQYRIHIRGNRESSYLSGLELDVYGENVFIALNDQSRVAKVIFRGVEYTELVPGKRIHVLPGTFPTIYTVDKESNASVAGVREAVAEAAKILRSYAHHQTSLANITQSLAGATIGRFDDTIDRIRSKLKDKDVLYKRFASISQHEIDRIWLQIFFGAINQVIGTISNVVAADITNGSYLAPIRAQANRYYRRQELAVDQIDPAGVNLAMYLNSLSHSELGELNKDLSEFFDHTVSLQRAEGHISIRLEETGEATSDNLADVGFGFSQLLPVIAQIYAAGRGSARPSVRSANAGGGVVQAPVLAIEQPELHLHPAYQARLGTYFVNAAKRFSRRGVNCRFVIETHSEQLVNALASMIGRKELRPDEVRIYLFGRDVGERTSRVVEAEIKPDGSIPNWPFGFFSSGRIGS